MTLTKSSFGPLIPASQQRHARTARSYLVQSQGANTTTIAIAAELPPCTKRQVLLGIGSMLLAPWLAQKAEAVPINFASPVNATDGSSPSLNGFDGEGGNDADYANAEVMKCADEVLLVRLPDHCSFALL